MSLNRYPRSVAYYIQRFPHFVATQQGLVIKQEGKRDELVVSLKNLDKLHPELAEGLAHFDSEPETTTQEAQDEPKSDEPAEVVAEVAEQAETQPEASEQAAEAPKETAKRGRKAKNTEQVTEVAEEPATEQPADEKTAE
ncbi:hypothetical protein [Ralstonia phage RSP15]|uniref:hypothetical protein n=1 Tax=Ralstonia phage RSP15 TaxID=1785960 RepID=UPI00074D2A0B|nr:hypothetical protein BH754_gp136 [Ralstonia phage RSP15]BAU40170.1 hypothetical protein [Ralstonia phage RSP15]